MTYPLHMYTSTIGNLLPVRHYSPFPFPSFFPVCRREHECEYRLCDTGVFVTFSTAPFYFRAFPLLRMMLTTLRHSKLALVADGVVVQPSQRITKSFHKSQHLT